MEREEGGEGELEDGNRVWPLINSTRGRVLLVAPMPLKGHA